jgi:formate dehydrogenase subunit beta
MAFTAKIEVRNADPSAAIRELLKTMLADEAIAGVLVQRRMAGGAVMPSLVTDPDRLDDADPLAPAFPMNSARLLAKLTRGEGDGMIAAVLRPCEIRAFVELVKLNQGSMENLLLFGVDCPGAFDNVSYRQFAAGCGEGGCAGEFLRRFLPGGKPATPGDGPMLAKACLACEHPSADAADGMIGILGNDPEKVLTLISQTPKCQGVMNRMGLLPADPGQAESRQAALEALRVERIRYRDVMFQETSDATNSLEKLGGYLAGCVNCYNCRVACPVCYCRECVFVTDVFDHKPWQYLGWAKKKGVLKLPEDTLFYHLTRLAHMSAACVGCGQCSNACPNGVPVMELFRMTAAGVQDAFSYEAGRDPEQAPPLSVFLEREFSEVTGGTD